MLSVPTNDRFPAPGADGESRVESRESPLSAAVAAILTNNRHWQAPVARRLDGGKAWVLRLGTPTISRPITEYSVVKAAEGIQHHKVRR